MSSRIAIFLIVMLLALSFVSGATLHGAVYDSSYNLIKNVQLEINSTPKQNYISKNGLYFFNVDLGVYEIVLEKYYQGQLIYSSTKIVKVRKDGEFNIDLMVETQPGVELPPDEEDLGPSLLTLLRARYGYLFYVALGFVIVIVGLVVYFYWNYRLKKKKKSKEVVKLSIPSEKTEDIKVEKVEDKPEIKEVPSEDLDGVMKIIKEEGGRTTQKDIRKRIPLSEAKISLMVSELEAKGKVQKIKKGRGNIIILK